MTTDEELKYQFSGYQLPTIQLDETGPNYIVLGNPHPYYRNQPAYWSHVAYGGTSSNQGVIGNDIQIDSSGNASYEQATTPVKHISLNMIPLNLV